MNRLLNMNYFLWAKLYLFGSYLCVFLADIVWLNHDLNMDIYMGIFLFTIVNMMVAGIVVVRGILED